jgi:DNA topoisomerase-1
VNCAVEDALKHPRDIDQNLRKAQEARRVLDRLVGYDLSGLIWKKVRYGLSAGRVQSPALRILVEREREIRGFKSHPYWILTADVNTPKKEKITLTCEKEILDRSEAEKILESGKKSDWKVLDVKESEVKRSPRPPFITSTLQQAASTQLGFTPSRTMSIAQKLYEAGLITYMRTDSTNLAGSAVSEIASVIEKKFGRDNLQVRKFASKSKNAQEAHEAIRPSHATLERAGHTDDQKKLYDLIWRRTVASQMKDASVLRTKVIAEIVGSESPNFSANGSRTIYAGWLLADPGARGDDIELPKVSSEEKLDLIEMKSEEKETEPPGRYSEAGLVKELEKRGIGRPSTYASIIGTLEDRGYVDKINKALHPTDTGEVVSDFLEKNFPTYISDDFTAKMEDDLDKIADGSEDYEKMLGGFYKPFRAEVKAKEKLEKVTNLGDADPKIKCPVCGSGMIIKLGRNGKFLSCSRYPDCDGALTIDGKEMVTNKPLGTDPETGLPIFVMNGRYGPYVQLGDLKSEKSKVKSSGKNSKDKKVKPKMASIPKGKDPATVTVADALVYLSLPRTLGAHPETGEPIVASVGRFGPYIVHQKDFRSVKAPDDIYTIELSRALQILAEPKKVGRGRFAKKK